MNSLREAKLLRLHAERTAAARILRFTYSGEATDALDAYWQIVPVWSTQHRKMFWRLQERGLIVSGAWPDQRSVFNILKGGIKLIEFAKDEAVTADEAYAAYAALRALRGQ